MAYYTFLRKPAAISRPRLSSIFRRCAVRQQRISIQTTIFFHRAGSRVPFRLVDNAVLHVKSFWQLLAQEHVAILRFAILDNILTHLGHFNKVWRQTWSANVNYLQAFTTWKYE